MLPNWALWLICPCAFFSHARRKAMVCPQPHAPAEPFRSGGAVVSSATRSTSYKDSLRPSMALSDGRTGNSISRQYLSGAVSDQLTYGHGTQSTMVRSETIALGGQENVDFDVAGRR